MCKVGGTTKAHSRLSVGRSTKWKINRWISKMEGRISLMKYVKQKCVKKKDKRAFALREREYGGQGLQFGPPKLVGLVTGHVQEEACARSRERKRKRDVREMKAPGKSC